MLLGGGIFDLFSDYNPIEDILEQARIKQKEFGEKVQESLVGAVEQVNPELAEALDTTINSVCNAAETVGNTIRQQGKYIPALHTPVPDYSLVRKVDTRVTVDQCRPADHLYRDGAGLGSLIYTHHAIYIGNGKVLHYAHIDDDYICIHEVLFEEFAEGHPVYRMSGVESPLRYSREEAVQRALSRKWESEYNLAVNNCENFVRWCRNGRPE